MNRTTARNIALFPWYKFTHNLLFWQAIWFLYFQGVIGAAEAILLYVVSDMATTLLEVPSGYMSDRLGRRITLILSGVTTVCGVALLANGNTFGIFALGEILVGIGWAFASGTDSSLLYESLAAEGREDEVEAQEVRAWRAGFSGLAVSAVMGGALSLWDMSAAYWATGLAYGVLTLIALSFAEPPHAAGKSAPETLAGMGSLRKAARDPLLRWLFGIAVLMYGFGHLPFVFGQPYILEAMNRFGLAQNTPLISGMVAAIMIGISLLVSRAAPALRKRLGLYTVVLLAFGLQIGLAAGLALTNSAPAIALLFLRKVPEALSQPFISAAIQPRLSDDSRATYLSLQSLCGRVLFSITLFIAAGAPGDRQVLQYEDIRVILGWYVLAGLVCFGVLLWRARRLSTGR